MITQDKLKQLCEYVDGRLVWRVSTGRVKRGAVVGGKCGRYYAAQVDGNKCYVHQLVFLYHHGYVPATIDHIDGNPANNTVENLRACTQTQNSQNAGLSRRNTSGAKNVSWDKGRSKWVVQVRVNGKSTNFGRYSTFDEAVEVARKVRQTYFGEFSRDT